MPEAIEQGIAVFARQLGQCRWFLGERNASCAPSIRETEVCDLRFSIRGIDKGSCL